MTQYINLFSDIDNFQEFIFMFIFLEHIGPDYKVIP